MNKLSIVIPVGFNEICWRRLVDDLTSLDQSVEIILSACQPIPENLPIFNHVYWIQSEQGRAKQLNAGAKRASRQVIWFLHADTQLSDGVVEALNQFIQQTELSLGYFDLKFAQDGPWSTRLNAWAANLRSRYARLPFGDQGLIVRKSVFERLNGFDESVLIGEDMDFVIRAQSMGINLFPLAAALITSARRYRQYGWLKTTLKHLWLTIVLAYQANQRLKKS